MSISTNTSDRQNGNVTAIDDGDLVIVNVSRAWVEVDEGDEMERDVVENTSVLNATKEMPLGAQGEEPLARDGDDNYEINDGIMEAWINVDRGDGIDLIASLDHSSDSEEDKVSTPTENLPMNDSIIETLVNEVHDHIAVRDRAAMNYTPSPNQDGMGEASLVHSEPLDHYSDDEGDEIGHDTKRGCCEKNRCCDFRYFGAILAEGICKVMNNIVSCFKDKLTSKQVFLLVGAAMAALFKIRNVAMDTQTESCCNNGTASGPGDAIIETLVEAAMELTTPEEGQDEKKNVDFSHSTNTYNQ
uniref:Wsv295-like protein n=1 Tax=Metapenaeus ensis nimavirus TaxID=2133794 RepID=A0A401IPD1_9VIRU|nr:MAG: wsv295-like protein [Metapenaeus ensis nimavirus]GBG35473.1 wsv295-like protein [Metapenaeus ensis nimavirus]